MPAVVANAPAPSVMADFHNCLTTLQLPNCAYSEERYSDMLILIHFRRLDSCARQLAAQTWRSRSQAVRTGPFLSKDAYWYRELNRLRMSAYGIGLDDWSICHCPAIVEFPWALTDHEFMSAYRYVYTGQWPDDTAFDPLAVSKTTKQVAGSVYGKLSAEALKKVEWALALYGGRTIELALRAKNLGGFWGAAIGIAVDVLKQQLLERLEQAMLSNLKIRYEVDRVRRGAGCRV